MIKTFNFRTEPRLAAALKVSGIDAVSLANNHIMDYWPEGVSDTLATLEAMQIGCFGAGTNLAQARQPAIVERKGVKIAFLGYLFFPSVNSEPKEIWATENKPGAAGTRGDLEGLVVLSLWRGTES